ncbi:saccharopine dehydrogenase [Halobacteriales archaeon QH_2_66_30]|nr:MAG: saccharopine dehydrogenase [Halobacteriales archaeon QH_2_66_30]
MTLLLYGAYGYTGELIAREAVDRDLDVIVAGRNGTKTRGVGIQLGTESRVFPAAEAGDNLDGVDTVLNCAGPFVETYEPFVEACLESGTHYLDITGEFPVFDALAERDREAEKAGVCLLPGAGFDVVPTDCTAGHLHDRLQGATHLRLGFEGPKHAVRIPWGDVSTAYYTTGIENVEVYTAMPELAARAMEVSQPVSTLLSVEPVKRGLQALGRQLAAGPSETERERGRTYVWGEATDGERTVTSRLVTPETYALTVDAATTAAGRLENADADLTGYHTPATAFDPEFVLELDDVEGFFDDVEE